MKYIILIIALLVIGCDDPTDIDDEQVNTNGPSDTSQQVVSQPEQDIQPCLGIDNLSNYCHDENILVNPVSPFIVVNGECHIPFHIINCENGCETDEEGKDACVI